MNYLSTDWGKAIGENCIARNAHRMRVERAAASGGGRTSAPRSCVRGPLRRVRRDFREWPRPASNQGPERMERTQGTNPLASFRPSSLLPSCSSLLSLSPRDWAAADRPATPRRQRDDYRPVESRQSPGAAVSSRSKTPNLPARRFSTV